ncbi:NAD(+)/NADH kinase [Thermosphaera chiliense]|uniref:NAD kinase n=1 Tax=Thermosphaera chiliense TaxID=3402707 RepID=A0A7M1USA1_9CREN|nr:NAD(+)/NADH kinase [Thermosphaera aggregans]QOR94849.1 NAD(+)/NADH kinase [Thermosphaera aggregans]
MFSKVALIYKPTLKCIEMVKELSNAFYSRGSETILFTVDDLLPAEIENTQLVVVVGGDGTFLKASSTIQRTGAFILPIHCGRRGAFFDPITMPLPEIVENVLNGEFIVQYYPRLKACRGSDCRVFINELALTSIDQGRITGFSIVINTPGISSRLEFEGDGVLVASSPGSAAYNLSAGGPLVDAWNSLIIITPLNPMQLNLPPIILPSFSTNVRVSCRGFSSMFFDGEKIATLTRGEEVVVSGSNNYLRVIRFKPRRDLLKNVIESRWVSFPQV